MGSIKLGADLENTISFLLLGLPYLFLALSIGLFLGPLAADNGRGYGFSLFLGLYRLD